MKIGNCQKLVPSLGAGRSPGRSAIASVSWAARARRSPTIPSSLGSWARATAACSSVIR